MSPDAELPFQRIQRQFANRIRRGAAEALPPGVDTRHMAVYEELFRNNVEGFLLRTFPVARKLLSDDAWSSLVDGFLAEHRCSSPYFLSIPEEFIDWLGTTAIAQPPWLQELCHYEWLELAVDADRSPPPTRAVDPQGDLLTGAPVPNPASQRFTARWPVHQLRPGAIPEQPPQAPVHLLVWRSADEKVRFMEINAMTAALLDLVAAQPTASGRSLLEQLATAARAADSEAFVSHGAGLLERLRAREFLLGTAAAEEAPDTLSPTR